VFCLLVRYNAFAGGRAVGANPTGGGFQGAIHGRCFAALLRHFDCRMECFASPLNCRYRRFCSAFPDLDGHFGSLGSFFKFFPEEGCFEANPPFEPKLVEAMAAHMERLLRQSSRPLCFIVIIPGSFDDARAPTGEAAARALQRHLAQHGTSDLNEITRLRLAAGEEGTRTKPAARQAGQAGRGASGKSAIQRQSLPGWRRLRESKHLRREVTLPPREHHYVEATQHSRPSRCDARRLCARPASGRPQPEAVTHCQPPQTVAAAGQCSQCSRRVSGCEPERRVWQVQEGGVCDLRLLSGQRSRPQAVAGDRGRSLRAAYRIRPNEYRWWER
jgi:hypothetical protein